MSLKSTPQSRAERSVRGARPGRSSTRRAVARPFSSNVKRKAVSTRAATLHLTAEKARQFARAIDAANFLSAVGCMTWRDYRCLIHSMDRWVAALAQPLRAHALHVLVQSGIRQ